MTRDDVIRMAREAGWGGDCAEAWADGYEAGAAAEREACIGLVTDNDLSNSFGSRVDYRQQLCAAIRARGQS
jgi:hypothetical protein